MSDLAARLHGSRVLGDADTAACFSGRAQLQAMLDVEAALAAAEADAGVVPASCVASIQAAARAELYDPDRLAAEATETGNPVIPVVRHLTARVAESDADAARFVHWGATSQDILDTGLLLQLRGAVPGAIDHLARGVRAAAAHAERYRDATMAGRTWLQQATPVTFGLKAAGWADALDRSRRRLRTSLDDALVLQFGGATGTLASLGSRGLAVSERLAARLGLSLPDIPWHAHRDRFAQLAGALGIAAGTCGKIGRDVALLAQTEVGEASRGGGAGTRRVVDDAAEAESGCVLGRPRRRRPRAGSGRDVARRDGPGARARSRRLAGRVGHLARPGDLRGQWGPGGGRRAGRPARRHGSHARQRRGVRRTPAGGVDRHDAGRVHRQARRARPRRGRLPARGGRRAPARRRARRRSAGRPASRVARRSPGGWPRTTTSAPPATTSTGCWSGSALPTGSALPMWPTSPRASGGLAAGSRGAAVLARTAVPARTGAPGTDRRSRYAQRPRLPRRGRRARRWQHPRPTRNLPGRRCT